MGRTTPPPPLCPLIWLYKMVWEGKGRQRERNGPHWKFKAISMRLCECACVWHCLLHKTIENHRARGKQKERERGGGIHVCIWSELARLAERRKLKKFADPTPTAWEQFFLPLAVHTHIQTHKNTYIHRHIRLEGVFVAFHILINIFRRKLQYACN